MNVFALLKKMVSGIGMALVAVTTSAQTTIVITEIYYNQAGNDTLEFIEIYNKGASAVDLNGYKINNGVDFTFGNYVLGATQYVVVAKSASLMNSFFGVTSFQWTAGGSLSNSGEGIEVVDASGALIDSVHYKDGLPWDTTADGYGPSLILCDPSADNSQGFNWSASKTNAGNYDGMPVYASPGQANGICQDNMPPKPDKAKALSLNSIRLVFSEPVNSSADNISHYAGLNIASESRTSSGDTVYLSMATPLSLGTFYTLTVSNISDNAGNTMSASEQFEIVFNDTHADLVITEIMYHTPGTKDTLEFIEVYNNGTSSAQLGGYEFDRGVSFKFPTMSLPAGEYLVIAANAAFVNSFFNISGTLQWKNSSLSNTGEKLVIINTMKEMIDSLTYKPAWSPKTDGGGASLVLCNPGSVNFYPWNWSDSKTYVKDYQGIGIYATPGTSSGITCIAGVNHSATEEDGIIVYPNPSSGRFEISLKSGSYKLIDIYNVRGEKIYSDSCSEEKHYVNLSESHGIVLIMITELISNRIYTTRIVLD